ncbi:MAG: CehA/McbA family metallohydrolase [Acidimicrobiales bacterium]
MTLRPLVVVGLLAAVLSGTDAAGASAAAAPGPDEPHCSAATGVVTMSGSVAPTDAKTYRVLPFVVEPGTTRVEVGYSWTPTDGTTLDLGLWDNDGYRSPAGFRGWSGNREGRLDKGMQRAWVQADSAERAYIPGTIEPGRWHVELGIAEVAPAGATWHVEVRCTDAATGPEMKADPVDAAHVANPKPGWYRGDFHMHSWNSNPKAPTYEQFVQYGRDAGLDFLPMTEYVVNRHWNELGAVQRANPDILLWPGREVITYFGHVIVLGETPSTVEYRQGFEDVTMRDIQRDVLTDGATFGIAHPTVFPEAQFGSTCRGCEFQLSDSVDLDRVDTVEVLTDDMVVAGVQNPFVRTAIDFWQHLLDEGHKVTAVSGSDDKLGPGLGSSCTAVYATELSRTALRTAVRSGHAYVQALGAKHSPSLEMTATAPDGATAIMGDTVVADRSTMTVTVTNAIGQHLRVLRDGKEAEVVDIDRSPFVHTFEADRAPDEGPLGTYWRVETFDDVSLTTIANPIFLADRQPLVRNATAATSTTAVTTTTAPARADATASTGDSLRGPWTAVVVFVVVVAGLISGRRWVKRREVRGTDRPGAS